MKVQRYMPIALLIMMIAAAGCSGTSQSIKTGFGDALVAMKTGNAEVKADADYAAQDYTSAFLGYQKAAAAGARYSQFMLAHMYLAGEGTRRDPQQYLAWLRRSAESGYAPANYLMGWLYLDNNPTRAHQYLISAAQGEHGGAMHMLGLMYAVGAGVESSTVEALRWFRLAAAQGISVEPEFLSEAGIEAFRRAPRPSVAAAPQALSPQQVMVRQIQQRLSRLGYQPGPADGLMGQKTRTAIEAFQRANGLPPDGRPSQALLEALNQR